MKTDNRIFRLSGLLYWVTGLTMLAIPAFVLVALMTGGLNTADMRAAFPGLPEETVLNPGKTVAVIMISCLALPAILFSLWHMRALFALYRVGEILSAACARHILRIGQGLVALAIVGTLLQPLQVLILTLDNPPGARQISIGLSSDTVGFLLAGGLLVVIGWVMREAARAAEENAGFV